MLSETIVLLWLLPVVMNIILPLAVLGIWLGFQLLALVRVKMATGDVGLEAGSVQNPTVSVSKG